MSDTEIEDFIQQRVDAKKAKDFAKADGIRQSLLDQGVVLEDTRQVQFGAVLIKRSLDHKSVDTFNETLYNVLTLRNSSVGRA